MKLARGKSSIASHALIAIAGLAVMLALVFLITGETAQPRQHLALRHFQQMPPPPPPVDRWAFAPKDAFVFPPQLRPGFAHETESEAATAVDVASVDPATAADPNEVQQVDETEAQSTDEAAALPWQTNSRSAPPPSPPPPPRRVDRSDDEAPKRRRPYSRSLERRLAQISPGATARLKKKFDVANVSWPPSDIALIGIKDEKILELHARSNGGRWELIHRYPILAASGRSGPKLRQGDKQVPEGIYRIAWLNPNSAYHVSLRVNYPNAFDRKMARSEGRTNLGGDIMIHGKNLSAGCLAIGDVAVEEVFTVAALTGLAKVRLIIAPTDLRTKAVPEPRPGQPKWVPKLYTEIASAMSGYEATSPITTSSTNIASSFMSFFAK